MAKITYTYTDEDYCETNREISNIEFSMPDDLNIHEFKIICMRLASTMGYSESSIVNSFGKII